jgi:hypothetical protein
MSEYTLSGDLSQMARQAAFLREHGFDVGQINVYPILSTKAEYDRAMLMIFEHKVDGWWNYGRDCEPIRRELLRRRISCLKEDLEKAEKELMELDA